MSQVTKYTDYSAFSGIVESFESAYFEYMGAYFTDARLSNDLCVAMNTPCDLYPGVSVSLSTGLIELYNEDGECFDCHPLKLTF